MFEALATPPDLDPDRVGGTVWYDDDDVDSFGDLMSTLQACVMPSGYVANSLDCDEAFQLSGGTLDITDTTAFNNTLGNHNASHGNDNTAARTTMCRPIKGTTPRYICTSLISGGLMPRR